MSPISPVYIYYLHVYIFHESNISSLYVFYPCIYIFHESDISSLYVLSSCTYSMSPISPVYIYSLHVYLFHESDIPDLFELRLALDSKMLRLIFCSVYNRLFLGIHLEQQEKSFRDPILLIITFL